MDEMVIIATNMAGRGTDIILRGNPEFESKREMRKPDLVTGEERARCSRAVDRLTTVRLSVRRLGACVRRCRYFPEEVEKT